MLKLWGPGEAPHLPNQRWRSDWQAPGGLGWWMDGRYLRAQRAGGDRDCRRVKCSSQGERLQVTLPWGENTGFGMGPSDVEQGLGSLSGTRRQKGKDLGNWDWKWFNVWIYSTPIRNSVTWLRSQPASFFILISALYLSATYLLRNIGRVSWHPIFPQDGAQ